MQINVLEYLECGALRVAAAKPAIIDGDRCYSFRQLEAYSKRCATLLIRRGMTMRQPIAVYLPKCADTVFADLGILYSGNIFTNLDVKSPAQRIKAMLAHIGPVLIITSAALAPQLEAMGVGRETLFLIEEIHNEQVGHDNAALWRRLDGIIDTDPLCIINTSGSTGLPKGVVLNHRGTIDFMDWCFETLQFDGSERIGSLSPFYFDIYTLELNLCLAKGATIVIIPEQLAIFPAKLTQFLDEQAISFLFWVPSIMVNIGNQGLLGLYDLTALRTVLFAGEVFPMKHLNCWRKALPQARFINLYGPIEITVDCTYFVVDREFGDDEALPIGFPCRNTDILVLNEDNRSCATGERGELCVRGSSLAMGYWNDPEKTAKAFVQNPLNTSYPELIYRTGDIVYRNESGELMYVGRKDFQIKHMGYRIELLEIEYQAQSIDGIANACVVYNTPKKEITLFYESNGLDLSPAAIRQKLGEIFPKYMLPTAFHRMQELPRNANGKIDRNGLSERLQEMA